jgi:sirohydrochlorin ferrochelatase
MGYALRACSGDQSGGAVARCTEFIPLVEGATKANSAVARRILRTLNLLRRRHETLCRDTLPGYIPFTLHLDPHAAAVVRAALGQKPAAFETALHRLRRTLRRIDAAVATLTRACLSGATAEN